MKREDKFVGSHLPYAVALDDPRTRLSEGISQVHAVWFRRKRGNIVACTGYLWDHLNPGPTSVAEFLARSTDGRYGGTCEGRWDGRNYWGAQDAKIIGEHLTFLSAMLNNFPEVPPGYEGWYTYRD